MTDRHKKLRISDQRCIDDLCVEFERDMQASREPVIEEFLDRIGSDLQPDLLRALMEIELDYRTSQNDDSDIRAYKHRFPDFLDSLESLLECGTTLPLAPSTLSQDSATLRSSSDFGDYELLEEIARGGMGVIYKAHHKRLDRIVALKMIRSGEFANQEEVDRFHKEAESAAKLDHPGIVPVYDVGKEQGLHFFTMGFVDGESLAVQLRVGPLAPLKAAQYAKSISEAVQHAHSKNVIHRDLKPGNVLITKDGTVRITDFGLAKRIEGDSELTSTGQVLGTPSYMPPEQAAGSIGDIGPAADIYAIGATLYCTLIGKPPFQAANVVETLQQVINDEPLSLRSQNRAIPADLETICLKCLEKIPHNRYLSTQALVDDLDRFSKGEPIHSRPIGRIERAWRWSRRNPFAAGFLLLLIVLAIGGPWSAVQQSMANRRIAIARADSLMNASPTAIPIILTDIDRDFSLVESRLIGLMSTDLTDSQQLRISLALLPANSDQLSSIIDRMNDCSYEELAIVLDRIKSTHISEHLPDLWHAFRNQQASVNRRFRAGIALAALDSDSNQWTEADYELLTFQLLEANTLHQRAIRKAVRSVADKLITTVTKVFLDELAGETIRESAANAIVDFSGKDLDVISYLSTVATPKQHSILFPSVVTIAQSDDSIIDRFVEQTVILPEDEYDEAQRIELGRRRAGAAINLIRLKRIEESLRALRTTTDLESVTQFIHRCKSRGVEAMELLGILNSATADSERYGVLLALGEFSVDEIADEIRSTWIEYVMDLYANDPSSGIHGASGWLLRQWGCVKQADSIEQRAMPYSFDREWFTIKVQLTSATSPSYLTFVVIDHGVYQTGSPPEETNRQGIELLRSVEFTRPFAMLDREITFGEFQEVTGFAGLGNAEPWMVEPDNVMVAPMWYMAVSFCRQLSVLAGFSEGEQVYDGPKQVDSKADLDPDSYPPNLPRNWPARFERTGFRLPTEAEWEVACRGGTQTTYSFGSDRKLLEFYGWYRENAKTRAQVPRLLRPNRLGIYDMHGNVYEWCHDWHEGDLSESGSRDPAGPPDGRYRVLRGGAYSREPFHCRSAYRSSAQPTELNYNFGFRLAVTLRPAD